MALVDPLAGERSAVHTANHPMSPEQMLPVADVVLLVADDRDGTMVFRYTAHGEFGGDTLHTSIAEAKAETAAEYADALHEWEEVPEEIGDAHAFAIRHAREQLNDRDGY
jgi:hypothetical protein